MANIVFSMLASLLAVHSAVAAALPATQAITCVNGVHMIVARGTTEPQGLGLQRVIVDAIKRRIPDSDAVAVVYPASYDMVNSESAGVKNMTTLVTQYAAACPDSKQVLMGYSQGAEVTGDVMSGGGSTTFFGAPSNPSTPLPDDVANTVAAVIVFGDPNRQSGQSYDKGSCTAASPDPRTGELASKFNSYSPRIQSYCNAGDPICCETGNDFLDHLAYFTPKNGQAVADFVAGRVGA